MDETSSNNSLPNNGQVDTHPQMMLQVFLVVGTLDTTKNQTSTALPFPRLVLRTTFKKGRKGKSR